VRPALSVVVPSVNGWQDLCGCLEALETTAKDLELEVLIADRCGGELPSRIAARFPGMRVLHAAPGTPIPDLRSMAFDAARGDAVAVIEDHVLVPPDWARRLVDALGHGEEIVGGAVANAATERTVDWAAFLCEYSHLLPPLPPGSAKTLAGNNIVYRRSVLERYRAVTRAGRWEDHLHDALRRDGLSLVCHPEIQVAHKKHYAVWEYVDQRFLYARSFAATRLEDRSRVARVGYAVAALALPPLLLVRIVARVGARRRYRRVLVKSLPLLALFVLAWAAGEVVGALAGPGDSLSRVS